MNKSKLKKNKHAKSWGSCTYFVALPVGFSEGRPSAEAIAVCGATTMKRLGTPENIPQFICTGHLVDDLNKASFDVLITFCQR